MMAAIVTAHDRTGSAIGTKTQEIRIIMNVQRFMAIFTINPAIRVLSPQGGGAK
jgi:hypothetical protein